MLEGAVVTVELFVLTLVISLPLGLPIALGSNSPDKASQLLCKVYVWIFRERRCCCSCSSFISFSRWCWIYR